MRNWMPCCVMWAVAVGCAGARPAQLPQETDEAPVYTVNGAPISVGTIRVNVFGEGPGVEPALGELAAEQLRSELEQALKIRRFQLRPDGPQVHLFVKLDVATTPCAQCATPAHAYASAVQLRTGAREDAPPLIVDAAGQDPAGTNDQRRHSHLRRLASAIADRLARDDASVARGAGSVPNRPRG